jgi:NDP-sugar pyrophosphorylase family protein
MKQVKRMNMKAVILAGGLGTRLRSIVHDRPKAMAEFNARPFLEYQLLMLKQNEIKDIVLCVGYMYQSIRDYFQLGDRFGLNIEYTIEDKPLGTAGAIKNAKRYLDSPFLVLNGDSFLDLDLRPFLQFHQKQSENDSHHVATIVTTLATDTKAYGSISTNSRHAILKFEEKRDGDEPRTINAGVYACLPALLNFIPKNQQVSIERDTFPRILEEGFHLYAYPVSDRFIDIGTPAGYARFTNYVKEKYPC